MLISRNWLQSHFETELPDAESIANTLMLHSFEIEGIEEKKGDFIIDIDVLPNRAHDCLSYAGVAREYAVLTGYALTPERYHYHDNVIHDESTISVTIDNPDQCYRYMARCINNVTVTDSPKWLQERIESMGQRSINNIVDATNYVMFDLGNPIHAFDADKIIGGITIRNAQDGETMTTLTGEELVLVESDLVICDDEGILALAGVKGGTKAEVTAETKNIVLEVANFNPTTTRTTSRRVKILTDSSKRFENEISSETAPVAMEAISRLVGDILPAESLGAVVDVYPTESQDYTVSVDHEYINRLLGLDLSANDVETLFEKMDYQVHTEKGSYTITIPYNRLDLRIPEDIIEELGRIYGYHNIPVKSVDDYGFVPEMNTTLYVENTLKNFLTSRGFSELKNYSFLKKGDRMVKNPLASDKQALRKNLHKQMLVALDKNHHNSAFFGTDRTMIFETGRVYGKDNEYDVCCIAIQNNSKREDKKYGTEHAQLEQLVADIGEIFDTEIDADFEKHSISFDVNQILTEVDSYNDLFDETSFEPSAVFHFVSPFPFTTRDISFWVSNDQSEESLRLLIENTETKYLQKIFLFDRFEKEGRVSYAFSLVFQSDTKTLTDSEVNDDMGKINHALENIGAEIR